MNISIVGRFCSPFFWTRATTQIAKDPHENDRIIVIHVCIYHNKKKNNVLHVSRSIQNCEINLAYFFNGNAYRKIESIKITCCIGILLRIGHHNRYVVKDD